MFQDFRLLKDRNIYDNIAFAQRVTETPTRIIKKKVPAALSLVGLAQKYKSFPKELSGGEQQRVAIARALITAPKIVLADEPTGALDSHSSAQVMKLFTDIHRTGQTILVVTHSVKTACYAGRVLFIRDGRLFNQLYRGDMDNEAFQEKISDNLKILLQKEGLDA